ncbi:MAG TPA: hypothetical protein DEP53_15445 [Bacteroidetes bacterium]|nr:hypothetical protein [Bacteroidota bacterium]
MNLSMKELVNKVVAEVLAELSRRGVRVKFGSPQRSSEPAASLSNVANVANMANTAVHVVDMSGFRSPVLLESHIASLGPEVKEIVVPCGTVVTPGAREMMKKKNLKLKNISKTN